MKRYSICLLAAASLLAGCGEEGPPPGGASPRIITLSPALTQIVFDMGCGDHVIGVTKHCTLPGGQSRRTFDALQLSAEVLLAAEPDVILHEWDSPVFAGVRRIEPDIRIERFRLHSLGDITDATVRIGEILGAPAAAAAALQRFEAKLDAVRARVRGKARPRTLFVMGLPADPAVLGAGSFSAELVEVAGGTDASAGMPGSKPWYPTVMEAIIKARPEVLICHASPDKAAAAAREWSRWQDLPAAQAGRVVVVTDDRYVRPGPRVADMAEKIARIIHPELSATDGGE